MIRVLLADDHRLVRRGLREILEEKGDIIVAGEASSTRQVLEALREDSFDVLLLDISMPDGGGLELLTELRRLKPDLKVLILTMHAEEQFARNAMRLGADGYLTKDSAPEELVAAVRIVAGGKKYVTRRLEREFERGKVRAHEALSKREFQILRMLAGGKSPTEIGIELGLSVKTVSTYRTRILTKLKLKNTAEIIRYAIRQGLIE